jgi:transposase
MVGGLDLHRRQITFDVVELGSGEEWRGRVWQPDRDRFRRWLRDDVTRRANGGTVALAVEGCTGWRYVVEEIEAAGFDAHLAEPADTQAARGRKRRAKTDRSDARLLRDLLVAGELPASWIPPEPVLEWRERVRLYVSLVNQRTVWCQRIRAELYHHGVAVPEGAIRTVKTRAMLADDALQLSPATRERIASGYRMIDATDLEAQPLKGELQRFGARQPACRALVDAQYGIGGLIAVAVWSELGDCRRFARSEQVVRHTGLDVTVDSSDRRRAGGFLSRQGPETLRWALYEAAKNSSHHRSPDHQYYAQVKERHDGKTAAISVARSSRVVTITCCATSTPTSSTRCPTEHDCSTRQLASPVTTSGSPAVSSCHRRARQHPCWTAFEH